ncbi:hypothetical protein J23TS9_10080 [Paenibacillus sp. J23TS9]|uniref:hypothetical protein n=1 Tax=Paenibacillus sp. J23TS9 TaxID=2807193 RepID=UPI001B262FDC|nr:hypothetical protein [Paenibacillus sp. J23TS9]GIP25878.1 hypothetical protein J23TS9_10080 [Paenibacillus sp. J23TS9]
MKDSGGKVQELEERIAALENHIRKSEKRSKGSRLIGYIFGGAIVLLILLFAIQFVG